MKITFFSPNIVQLSDELADELASKLVYRKSKKLSIAFNLKRLCRGSNPEAQEMTTGLQAPWLITLF